MCQPLPGPRCSSHTRATLERARARRNEALENLTQITRDREEVARETPGGIAADSMREINQRYWDADSKARITEAEYEAALREYETTPEGQRLLQESISLLSSRGEEEAANHARQRLIEASREREEQNAALRESRNQQVRLGAATAEETGFIEQVDRENELARQELHAAENALKSALDNRNNRQYDAVRVQDTLDMLAAEEADARQKSEAKWEEATGLFREYARAEGVSDETIDRFIEGSARRDTEGNRVSGMLVTYDRLNDFNDDENRVGLRRAMNAANDPRNEFYAANLAVDTELDRAGDAASEIARVRDVQNSGQVLSRDAQRDITMAQARLQRAQDNVESASIAATRARAQIAAGIGVQASQIDLRRSGASSNIVRQPDGTVNAWVYNEPSEGFPNGRFVRVTGVDTSYSGMSPTNALVLETGAKVEAHTHYARHGASSATERHSGYSHVMVTEPEAGSAPLASENIGDAGFHSFVDTTG